MGDIKAKTPAAVVNALRTLGLRDLPLEDIIARRFPVTLSKRGTQRALALRVLLLYTHSSEELP